MVSKETLSDWYSFNREVCMVGCREKANCLLMGPGPVGDVPSV